MVSTLLQLDTTQRLVGSLQRLSLGELPVKDLSSRINWLGTPKAGNAPQVIARTTVIESPAIATRVEVPTNATP